MYKRQVLTASSVQDVFAMTVEGFNMAETYRTPVILLFDEVVGLSLIHISPPFRVMSCNDVPVFWDDHCEYRDIFKKALT